MEKLKVVLLVGGTSSRFWPLGEKPLLRFLGKPLFLHQVDMLRSRGLSDILVISSPQNLSALQDLAPDLQYVPQTSPLGMAGALLDSAEYWQDSPLLVVSANDVIDPVGVQDLLANLGGDGALLAQRVKNYFPGGYLRLDGDKVSGIVEKPEPGEEPSDLVNLVFHYHQDPKALLSLLQNIHSRHDDIYELALDQLFQQKDYKAVEYNGLWYPLKYPWHALALSQRFLETLQPYQDPTAFVSPDANIQGNVYISAGVKIYDHACVVGPTYLGPNTIVGNNALVRQSDLGQDCVVGYNTEVARSLWGNGVKTHINYVGDSVFSDNVCLGAGAITANYRLDGGPIHSIIKGEKIPTHLLKLGCMVGANSRIGVHCTVSPGVKIGQDSMVSSHVLVNTDLESNKFLYLKHGDKVTVPNRLSPRKPR